MKEEKGVKYNQNKMNAINMGKGAVLYNHMPRKGIVIRRTTIHSCTNTGSSLKSNNTPLKASLPVVTDNVANFLLSVTIDK